MADLQIETRGQLGVVTLNRPAALNALSFAMVEGIAAALDRWDGDAAVRAVLFRGEGRAFCAGGDIKAAHAADRAAQSRFFAAEYALNRRLFHYPKPTIALMHGITMGGGYGLAGQCRLRIAREDSSFAMPEVGIGFFPDVGSAWHLARMPDRCGYYLGLTGQAIDAGDMMFCGAANLFVPADRWNELLADIAVDGPAAAARHAAPHRPGATLQAHRGEIAALFAGPSEMGDPPPDTDFIRRTRASIATRSPASVALAASHIAMAADEDFDTVSARDLDLASFVFGRADFYEGVRAMLIDKDKTPVWRDEPRLPMDMRPAGINIV